MNSEKTGELIASLRKTKKLTQQQLAEQIGVTRKAISRWETGRGYPDIELLPILADKLSVSINELLNGEKIPKESVDIIADNNITFVCQNAAKSKRINLKTIKILSFILIALSAIFAVLLISVITNYAESLIGSDNCIVANDYSYLTYYGERYVPLNTSPYHCIHGETIMKEVKKEGSDVLSKIFFGESLIEVKGVNNNEIIYLNTDYDELSTEYYVKESELKNMEDKISAFRDKNYYAIIPQSDDNEKIFLLENDYLPLINNLKNEPSNAKENCEYDYSKGHNSVQIITSEENNIFFKDLGELIYKNQKYYWYDYDGNPFPASVAKQTHPYDIGEEYFEILNTLFSYTHK